MKIFFPEFPINKPNESDALLDFNDLKNTNFYYLFENKEWLSRSELDNNYVLNYIVGKSNIGNKSSDCFHWQARMSCDSLTSPSPIRSWYDRKIRKSVESSMYYKENPRAALALRKYIASQFRPSAAKAIYELFGAKKIYDFCGGWGDRLSGALASDCELYYCRDVNPLVFSGYALQQQTYKTKVKTYFEYRGSEIDCPIENYFDLAFTSPPYFKVEKYQGDLQSHRQFKKIDDWLNGFLYPAITNAWKSLNEKGILAVNISDCYANHTYNKICMPMIEYALNNLLGCNLVGIIGYAIASRKKNGPNAEPIIIFSKDKDFDFISLMPKEHQQELF